MATAARTANVLAIGLRVGPPSSALRGLSGGGGGVPGPEPDGTNEMERSRRTADQKFGKGIVKLTSNVLLFEVCLLVFLLGVHTATPVLE
jgi:hypothetical protein